MNLLNSLMRLDMMRGKLCFILRWNMFLHPCFLAPLGEPFVSDADSPSAVRGPGDGHCAVSAQTEDLAPVYPFCRGGVSDPGGGRRHRGSFTVEASLLLVIILLVLALVMGLAVTNAVNSLYDVSAGIKWPNDVVIKGRKLCGILTEMSAEVRQVNYIVIGVGINANLTSFPEEIREIATSLKLELGRDINRAELIARVMTEFERLYAEFEAQGDLGAVMQEYNELCLNAGSKVRVLDPNGEYTGTSRGINSMGELLVETEDGKMQEVYAGEVSVRGIYGYV